MRRTTLWVVLVTCTISCASVNPTVAGEKPNFVWLLSEDNSKHYLKLFDVSGAPAPNIEALARDGIVFDRAFSCSPVCSVARTTLMTSCYGPRIGTQFHRRIRMANMPDGLSMFPAYLRAEGYYTTNNSKKDYNAVEGKGVWDESSKRASWRDRSKKEQPFFHMQSFGQSHESSLHFSKKQMEAGGLQTSPQDVTLADYHPDTPTFSYTYARYHDRMAEIDRQIGAVVAKLEEDGLLEDTFIFYFGDHGGVLPRSKGYLFESGLHVPLVVRVPKNFADQVTLKRGERSQGFVEFVDFGPTVLQLAGVELPEQIDGEPFLGPDISPADLAERDEAFGYADRFDEKYDFVRSLRKGKYKYVRNYQAYFPDGLQNNYRYRMLAYAEWRRMFDEDKLNVAQQAFFQSKPVEALYDLESDPYEVRNLAADSQHAETLKSLRQRLQQRVKSLPDLSFYPESYLVDHALEDAVAFGEKHKQEIATLADTIDLAVLPFGEARPGLEKALASTNSLERYWALTACGCYAEQAKPLVLDVNRCLSDEDLLVRLRAVDFLGIIDAIDPQSALAELLNETASPTEALIILNSVVYFRDCAPKKHPFDGSGLQMKVKSDGVKRRLDYLNGRL